MGEKITFTVGLTTQTGEPLNARDVELTAAAEFAAHGWDGFAVFEHRGYWRGVAEYALTFTVYTSGGHSREAIKGVATRLAAACNQECVLWAVEPAKFGFAP